MELKQYQSLAGAVFAIGLLVWLVLRSGDPVEAILYRDALRVFAAAVGAYGAGLRRGEQRASTNVGN